MTVAYVVAVALFVVCLSLRDVYELLKRSRRIDPTNPRVFAVVFASMITMWLSWFAVGALAPTRLAVTEAVRWAGIVAVLARGAVSVGGMWQLGGVENLILAPAGLASVLWWRHLEEAELSSGYGEEYREYRASTWC